MQPMTQGMNVDPILHLQVLEVKLTQLTVREAMLEAAVQQLTQENTQHRMEIARLNDIIKPPVDEETIEAVLEVVSLTGDDDESVIEVTEDASADSE